MARIQYNFNTIVIIVLCVLVIIPIISARPPWLSPTSGVFTESADCKTDDELLDLCQRCAKLTKSKLAYPSCCSTDVQARKWCSDYVYFGRVYSIILKSMAVISLTKVLYRIFLK